MLLHTVSNNETKTPATTSFYKKFSRFFITPNKKPRKWIVIFAAVYALYALLCGVILPPKLNTFAAHQLSKALQAPCTIEKITYNPFTFTLSASQISILYPADNSKFLIIDSVTLSPGISSIFRVAPSLGYLKIVKPHTFLSLSADGKISTTQFVTADPQPQEVEEESPPFPFIINNLEIVDGAITFQDDIHNTTHTVTNLHVYVPFASTRTQDKSRNIRPTLNATIDNRALSLEGTTTPFAESQRTEFRLRFGELPLEMLQPYITPYTTLTLEKGSLTAETVLHFEKKSNAIDMGFAGSLYINDLDIHAPNEGSVLSLQYGIIEMDHYLLELEELALSEVNLDSLIVRIAKRADGSINWEKYIRNTPLVPAKTAKPLANNTAQVATNSTAVTNSTVQGLANATAATNSTVQGSANATAATNSTVQGLTNATASTTPTAAPTYNATAAKSSTPPAPVTPSIGITKLSLTNGHLLWSDAEHGGKVIGINPITLHIKNLHTVHSKTPAYFSLTLGETSIADDVWSQLFMEQNTALASALSKAAKASDKNGSTPVTSETQLLHNSTSMGANTPAKTSNATVLPSAIQKNATTTNSTMPPVLATSNSTVSSVHLENNGTQKTPGKVSKAASNNATISPKTSAPLLQPADVVKIASDITAQSLQQPAPTPTQQKNTHTNATLTTNANYTVMPNGNVTASSNSTTGSPKTVVSNQNATAIVTAANNKNATAAITARGATAVNGTGTSTTQIPANNATGAATSNSNATAAPPASHQPAAPALALAKPKPPVTPLGNVAIRGSLQLSPPHLEALVHVESMPLTSFAEYFAKAGMQLKKGTLQANTQVRFLADKTFSASLHTGTVSLRNVETSFVTPAAVIEARIAAASIGGLTFDETKNLVTLESAVLDTPAIQLALQNSTPTNNTGKKVPATTQPTKAGNTSKQPLQFTVSALNLSKGTIEVSNPQAKATQFVLGNMEFAAKNISTIAKAATSLQGQATWNNTGKVSLQGGGTLTPLNLTINTVLNQVPLASLAPWVKLVTKFDIPQGVFSCETAVTFAEAGIKVEAKANPKTSSPQAQKWAANRPALPAQSAASATSGFGVAIAGKASIDNLVLYEAGQEALRLKKLRLFGIRANTAANTYDIGGMVIDNPYLTFSLYPNGLNTFTRAMDITGELAAEARKKMALKKGAATLEKAIEEAKQASGKQTSAPTKATVATKVSQKSIFADNKRVSIGRLTINNGAVRFKDETLPRRAAISLQNLTVKGENITSAQPNATTFTITAKAEGAPLAISAQINPLFTPLNGSATIDLTAMDMVPLSPYCEKFMAYPINKGTLTLKTVVKTDGTVVDATNTVVLGNLTLGDKLPIPNAPNIPIKTGLSILADSQNNVTLSLPVAGRLDDPNFKTGNVVAKVFGNVLFKVVASPFSLLGAVVGAVGSDQTNLEMISFASGDAVVSTSADKAIDSIISLLKKREKMTLVLHGMADEKEKSVIAPAYIARGVQQKKWESLSSSEQEKTRPDSIILTEASNPAEYEKYLFEFYADQDFKKPSILGITKKQPVPVMIKMITDAVGTSDQALEQLALQRAAAVQAAIIKRAPELSARVTIAPDAKLREAAAGQPLFSRVELTAQ